MSNTAISSISFFHSWGGWKKSKGKKMWKRKNGWAKKGREAQEKEEEEEKKKQKAKIAFPKAPASLYVINMTLHELKTENRDVQRYALLFLKRSDVFHIGCFHAHVTQAHLKRVSDHKMHLKLKSCSGLAQHRYWHEKLQGI